MRLKSRFDHVERAPSQSSCKKRDISKYLLISDIVMEKEFKMLTLRGQSAAMGEVAWRVLKVSAM